MDRDIKRENSEISDQNAKALLDYAPLASFKPEVIDDRTTSYTEGIYEQRIKKIRKESDKRRSPYPWEQEEVVLARPKKEKKEYKRQVYTVQPSDYRKSYGGKSKISSTYVVTAEDGSLDQSNKPVDNSAYGTPSTFVQKSGNYTFTNQGHPHGWTYAILPGTENIKNIDTRLAKVMGRPKPGEKNADLPNRVLAVAPGAVGKNNKLHVDCVNAWIQMREAAKKEGLNIIPYSCYRDYDYQLYLWNKYGKNPKRVGRPGHSNHGWGRAMDIGYGASASKQKKWVTNNGHKWGWFWGDAKGEDWHFVYCW